MEWFLLYCACFLVVFGHLHTSAKQVHSFSHQVDIMRFWTAGNFVIIICVHYRCHLYCVFEVEYLCLCVKGIIIDYDIFVEENFHFSKPQSCISMVMHDLGAGQDTHTNLKVTMGCQIWMPAGITTPIFEHICGIESKRTIHERATESSRARQMLAHKSNL